ncbi:MAG: hypothetical protein QG611_542 [Bacteroidota bacterium]|nr:hypothetical protein [Bacteroidota bacterium]
MLKKLLFVFLILLQISVIGSWAVGEVPDSISPGLSDRFVFPQAADNPEFPPLKLLQTALAGYELLLEEKCVSRPEVITIIDFSLPSDKERLWVLDLNNGKVLFRCLVSHGRNSGELMAEKFSNIPGSNASSPGFYTTGETYMGKHGLSLALDGLETGINDKARARAIVIHGADYVSAEFIRKYGRLGRSFGCPAVPEELSKEIIQTIKGGSCLFIYAPEITYISNSQIITKITSITKV